METRDVMNERVRGAPVGIGRGGMVVVEGKDALVNKPRLLRERTMRCGRGRAGSGGMFILPARRTGSHGESLPPPRPGRRSPWKRHPLL